MSASNDILCVTGCREFQARELGIETENPIITDHIIALSIRQASESIQHVEISLR